MGYKDKHLPNWVVGLWDHWVEPQINFEQGKIWVE